MNRRTPKSCSGSSREVKIPRMHHHCEVCANFRPGLRSDIDSGERIEIQFFKRKVTFCTLHAHLVNSFRVTTIQGLRSLFRENRGKRSFVSRRVSSPESLTVDRRQPHLGRRASDLAPSV
jgi:hypothetical protein